MSGGGVDDVSPVCCEECGGSAEVNWYCPACGGALCDTCNAKLNLHVKKHSDVVRRIGGASHPQFELEELKREQKALEKQITEAAELNNTVHKCISDRFSTLRILLDAKEKEFTNKAARLVTEQTYVLSHIQEIIERREHEAPIEGSSSSPSYSPLSEEEEQLIAELRGGTGIFARGERLALDLRCAATAGLREAARISAFIGTLDASHVTYPIITALDTSRARTCHSIEVEWATDMPDLGMMTYQLEYRSAAPGAQDGFKLAYEGKASRALVEDLSENSEYAFRVRISYDGELWSKWTAEARGTTLPLPCPENIVTVHSPTAISLSWAAVKAHTSRNCVYQVAYRDEDFNETKYKDNPTTVEGDGVTSWTVGGLTPQKLYMFTVRAGFDGKWSEWSQEVEVVTQIPRPSDLTPLNITPVSLTVSWHLDTTVRVKCDAKEKKGGENAELEGKNDDADDYEYDEEVAKKNKKKKAGAPLERRGSDTTPRQQQQQQQQNRGNIGAKKKGKRMPLPSTTSSTSPSPVPSLPPPSSPGSTTSKKAVEKHKKDVESHTFQAELTRLQDNEVVSTYTGNAAEVTFEGLTPETKYSLRVRAEWDGVWGKWCNALEVETEWSKYFKWAQCPLAVKRKRAYTLDAQRGRVATASTAASGDEHCTVLGAAPFLAGCVTDWEIRVLKSKDDNGNLVYVGVAPAEMSQDDEKSISHGWFFSCYKSALFSGKPDNFWCKEYGPRKANGEYVKAGDSVCASMDTTLGRLSFALKRDGVLTDLGVAFEGIPLDKPLVPAVIMYNCGDSVEFI